MVKNVKQLSTKESLQLWERYYNARKERNILGKMVKNQEKTIQSLINRMIDLENDLKYEVKLNSLLQEKIEKKLV